MPTAAIDRAHLRRMTHGDRDLEREVLGLFTTQLAMLLDRMQAASPAAAGAMAHTLLGSAQSIGAWTCAGAAADVERAAAAGRLTAAMFARLTAAARAVQAEIADITGP